MAIYHCSIKIIKRSQGRSAVAAAAYRSGQKLTNEWDGITHDYTKKRGVVHSEILLPAHAPSEFSDRSVLWNSVEKIEKSRNAQLTREIEIALPAELNRKAQIALVRTYVLNTFVASGMCADFSIHDKGGGNPHAHIMLTIQPLKENGEWGAKCRKEYELDGCGQRIRLPGGEFKSHRVDTTDWNDPGKAEVWRAAWADACNRALEQIGRPERIDHRSYTRQGVQKVPTVHMGVAATQMERRGIPTEKGAVNRKIAAQNRLLKEIKARITRLYNWTKQQTTQPEQKQSIWEQLQQA
ncbi:MobQ family relaxase [Caproicibacter fermentans]|uniref:MobQ family relaxase n=1 Tax=Caproicibacter fermentans TaxID=2576756 RepID=UPI0038B2F542